MRVVTYLLSDKLWPYVRQFVISETSDAQVYKIRPDTSLVMSFQYRGRLAPTVAVPLATSGITGIRDSCCILRNSPDTGSVLVLFT